MAKQWRAKLGAHKPTTAAVTLPYCGTTVTVPAGTQAVHVDEDGGGWAIDDIAWLVQATGNTHDPHYRFLYLPAAAFG